MARTSDRAPGRRSPRARRTRRRRRIGRGRRRRPGRARRVLPTPPGPVSVSSPTSSRSRMSAMAASSHSRPISGLRGSRGRWAPSVAARGIGASTSIDNLPTFACHPATVSCKVPATSVATTHAAERSSWPPGSDQGRAEMAVRLLARVGRHVRAEQVQRLLADAERLAVAAALTTPDRSDLHGARRSPRPSRRPGPPRSQSRRPSALSAGNWRSSRMPWRASRSPTKRGRRRLAAPGMMPSLRAGRLKYAPASART